MPNCVYVCVCVCVCVGGGGGGEGGWRGGVKLKILGPKAKQQQKKKTSIPNNQKLCSGDNKQNLKKKNKIKTSYFIFIEIINTAPMLLHPSVLLSSNILLQTRSVGIPS